MEPEEIRDRESLEAWLEGRPEEVRQREAVWIAMRAAARVFPMYGQHAGNAAEAGATHARDLTALPVLRCLLTSAVAAVSSTPEVRIAAAYAAELASAASTSFDLVDASIGASAAAGVARAAAERTATISVRLAAAAASNATQLFAVAADTLWEQIRWDVHVILRKLRLDGEPLWLPFKPEWFTSGDAATRVIWDKDPPRTWDFWLGWWEGLITGEPLDWVLQEKVVRQIPDPVWEQGPVVVAKAIREIELDLALARTDNAEELVPNPETGRLHLVPTSRLPGDADRRARRAMERAAGVFGNAEDNQYRALGPDLDMLREVAGDTETSPVEMFDACVSATRRLRIRVANGECPDGEHDALVQDYSGRLVDIAADILASDEVTQEVLTRRNAIKGNDALTVGREEIIQATQLVLAVVEGRLGVALPADAEIATNPQADAEERKDASVRLSGRMVRIGAYVGVAGGGAVIGTQQFIEAVEKLAADPVLHQAIAIIMKWLGLG